VAAAGALSCSRLGVTWAECCYISKRCRRECCRMAQEKQIAEAIVVWQLSGIDTACLRCRGGGQALPPASPASHESDVNNPEVRHKHSTTA
jgi:hypothetical protein